MVAVRNGISHAVTPNYGTREYNFGARGSQVRGIQRGLNALGYNLAEDGVYGNTTKSAVRDFQRRNGLQADGIVGPQTRQAMSAVMPNTADPIALRTGTLRPNNQVTESNRTLQRLLNALGYRVAVDGRFGRSTVDALKSFQRENGLRPDGVLGRRTLAAMRNAQGGASPDAYIRRSSGPINMNRTRPDGPGGNPANRTAKIERYQYPGQRRQMAIGKITVNGKTYQFRSGGGGRGNLPPGDYKITPHLWNRSDRTMQVGGVGWSFAMSDKYDPRVGGTRKLLRIHPDGGGAGTIGCIGIVGNAQTQRTFREDMRAELARNGGRFTLRVN